MNMAKVYGMLLGAVLSACTSGSSSSGGACQADPQGAECQDCLKRAADGCVGEGKCKSEHDALELCATAGCTDPSGQSVVCDCSSRQSALSTCLVADCEAWNVCLGN
jgi:hypothetical protein